MGAFPSWLWKCSNKQRVSLPKLEGITVNHGLASECPWRSVQTDEVLLHQLTKTQRQCRIKPADSLLSFSGTETWLNSIVSQDEKRVLYVYVQGKLLWCRRNDHRKKIARYGLPLKIGNLVKLVEQKDLVVV